ncbi:MAG: hypothetical protein IPK00_06120 [Deltaproteobacteria bacterium]|nr:hypothetical protein [Deltaproteobacteria bacterium]
MSKRLLRVAAFVAITLLLTWLWNEGGRMAYGRFLKAVAPPIYDLLGFDGARVGAFRQRYVNFVPFIGLVLVTPGLSRKRRLLGLAIGLVVLFCGHLALNLTEVGRGRARHLPILPSLVSDTLPFLVWLGVAAPMLVQWLPGGPASTATDPGAEAIAEPPATAIERSTTPEA